MTDTDPIIVADAGPLIRLAAAGLLDSMRLTNRRIVVVDRVEEEVRGDLSKPFAAEIAEWIDRMGDAIEHAVTTEGLGIARRRELAKQSPNEEAALMAAATVPMTLMSTRAFARLIAERGFNRDAITALESVAEKFNLKPPISTVVEPNTAPDE